MYRPPIICQIKKAFYVFHILCFNKKNQIWRTDSMLKKTKSEKPLVKFGLFVFCLGFFFSPKIILLPVEMN